MSFGYGTPLVRFALAMLPAIALLALAGSFGDRAHAQASEGTVRLTPAMTNVEAKTGPFTVYVALEDLLHLGSLGYDDDRDSTPERFVESVGLAAFEVHIQYDQSLLAFERVEPGPALGSTGRDFYCLPVVHELNRVSFGCVSPGPEPPGPQGNMTLASVSFRPLRAGSSALVLQADLTGPLGSDTIPVEVFGGVVRATGSPEGPARTSSAGATTTEDGSAAAGSGTPAPDNSQGSAATSNGTPQGSEDDGDPGLVRAGSTPAGSERPDRLDAGENAGNSEAQNASGQANGSAGGEGLPWPLVGGLGAFVTTIGVGLMALFAWRRRRALPFGE